MGEVAVEMKVMPADVEVDLNVLKQKIIDSIPAGARIYGEMTEQPIAFGLKALILTVLVEDGEGGVESVEEAIHNIPEAESIQILEMNRV